MEPMQAIRFLNSYIKTLRKLGPHLRAGRSLIVTVLVSSLAAGFFESSAILFVIPLLTLFGSVARGEDNGPPGDDGSEMFLIEKVRDIFPTYQDKDLVAVFCVLLLLAIIIKNVLMVYSMKSGAALRRRVMINLRAALYQRFHGAELQLFEENETGDLVSVFIQETHRAVMAIDYFITILQRFSIVLFYLALMLVLSWQLTLFTLVLAVFIGFAVGSIYRLTKRHGEAYVEANMKLNAHTIESFSGVRQIRTSNNIQETFRQFQETNMEQAHIDERQVRAVALLPAIVETIGVFGGIMIIAFANAYLLSSDHLSPEALIGFGAYLMRMLPIVSMVYSIRGQLMFMAEGLFEVDRWMDTPQHPQQPFGQSEYKELSENIQFQNITFSYPNGKKALDDISFTIQKGHTVALVGSSGSGKSTLATLLLRMRTPTSGQIMVDGRNHWEFTPESWHHRIATVEQDAFLFHSSLVDNICFGLKDIPEEKVWEVLKMAQLEEWVKTLKDGIHTIVGERGASLSGGQKQRLAIARALVRDPDILVLDEATSALDSVSERLVQEALDVAQRGRTVLVIAHRLSTIRHADKIVVMDKGAIVEDGTWEELEQKEGAFANFIHSSQAF